MRVITDNREGWTKEVECRDCHSVLEIEEEDIHRGQFGAMGDYDTEYYVDCPVCDHDQIIKFGDLPQFVRRAVDSRPKYRRAK